MARDSRVPRIRSSGGWLLALAGDSGCQAAGQSRSLGIRRFGSSDANFVDHAWGCDGVGHARVPGVRVPSASPNARITAFRLMYQSKPPSMLYVQHLSYIYYDPDGSPIQSVLGSCSMASVHPFFSAYNLCTTHSTS
jgi:hypothetical protein